MSAIAMPPSYSFLSKPPPPPQKKRPLCPPPPAPTTATRKRSSTFSAIAAWAAHVQPGSPSTPSTRRPSASFLVVDTPSPAPKDCAIDLTGLGYTSVFVHLPHTPSTPPMPSKPAPAPAPPTRTLGGPLKRFRSLSILRPRSNAPSTPTPALPPPSPSPQLDSPKITAASIAIRKKAVYAYAKSKPAAPNPKPKQKPALPPSLASELALMQFADGGSTEDNIKRLMAAHARTAAPLDAAAAPVADVYRDGKGGVWWDREEEMEYVHLLSGHSPGQEREKEKEKWVSFGGEVREGNDEDDEDDEGERALSLQTDAGRRGSATSIGSVALDMCNIVKPAEDDAHALPLPLPRPEPILTVPSRPRRHLRAAPNFFMLDLDAFVVPRTPSSPAYAPGQIPTPTPTPTPTKRRRGPARRRPAPLNIVAHVPVRGVSPVHEEDEDRRDFLEASFKPQPQPKQKEEEKEVKVQVYRVPTDVSVSVNVNGAKAMKAVKKKTSRNLLSLFGRK